MATIIVAFESYTISEGAHIISTFTGKEKQTYLSHNGYKKVKLRRNKKSYSRFVHKLLYQTFRGPIPKGFEVNHKDLNKLNNSLSNLEIISKRDNIVHSRKSGSSKYTFVYKRKQGWRGRVRIKGKDIAKSFKLEIDAARFVKQVLIRYNVVLKYAVLCD